MPTEINSQKIYAMLRSGGKALEQNVARIDALNVFPVPDGDTGTNMNLSFQAGLQEMQNNWQADQDVYGETLGYFSRGIMMGARGNSGVILSQLFRGMSQYTKKMDVVTAEDFALALEKGVEVAYKAVMKPVEGTILTVAREAAKAAVKASRRQTSIAEVFRAAIDQGEITLSQTPEMLPVLKEVGVVDAGGKGLLVIYEGMYQALLGVEDIDFSDQSIYAKAPAQAVQSVEDSGEYGYCTEFIVKDFTQAVDEADIKRVLAEMGDSLVVVSDDDFVKIHVHTLDPGKVLSYCLTFGSLHRIKIDNMTEQHNHLQNMQESVEAAVTAVEYQPIIENKTYGIVSVTNGEGIRDVFLSLGVDEIVFGGQSMNPSTEDLATAVKKIAADTVIILPNNKNIILAAEQVSELLEDRNIIVLPSKTIPEGIAAMLAFHEEQDVEDNIEVMKEAMAGVVSGQVTYAVRDTQVNGTEIHQGDILGIIGGDIVVNGEELIDITVKLLDKMIDEDTHEIITLFAGQDVTDEQMDAITNALEETYADMEIEIKSGLQPTYYFIISVE